MGNTKCRELFRQAFFKYMFDNQLSTDYETSMGWNNEEAHYGVFDMPPGYVPFADGAMHCNPEYRAKPVLYARMNGDGSVSVEETEYTDKYMRARETADRYGKPKMSV